MEQKKQERLDEIVPPNRKTSVKKIVLGVLQGVLIGAGAILPGISGGILCVLFGLYQPLIDIFSHPIRGLKAHYMRLLPFVAGYLAGVLLFAKLLVLVFERWEIFMLWFFIGLIAGTMPSLWKMPQSYGKTKHTWIAAVVGFIAMFFWLFLMGQKGIQITPSFGWWLVCGVLLGLSLIVPGLSYSTFYIYLGLFIPFNEGIATLNFGVLLPVGIGALVTIVLLSRVMKRLIAWRGAVVFRVIFGIVFASLVSILPLKSSSPQQIPIYIICFVAGCAAGYFMDYFSSRGDPSGTQKDENKLSAQKP